MRAARCGVVAAVPVRVAEGVCRDFKMLQRMGDQTEAELVEIFDGAVNRWRNLE